MKRLLAILLIATLATAQPPAIGSDEDYVARIAQGDFPSIYSIDEPSTGWNIAEYLRFDHDGTETRIALATSQGTIFNATCDCGNVTIADNELVIGSDAAAGRHLLVVGRNIDAGNAILVEFAFNNQGGLVVAYVPQGSHAATDYPSLGDPLACTEDPCTIEAFARDGTHFAILPGEATTGGVAPTPPADDGFDVLPWIAGILIGALVWALLVKQGVVQKRRKQEVVKAAHVEAAEAESKETLEARKRVLMSGLKELEKAKMAKEIDTDVYDALKAELKKETVTVMRALEAAE